MENISMYDPGLLVRRDSLMSRRKGVMSESLKHEVARELGVYDIVSKEGWGSVSSRDCGNMVRLAIEKASRNSASMPE